MLEIKFEMEEENDYIDNIKLKFKDKELYFGDFKDKSNLSSVMDGKNSGMRTIFNSLIHSY